MMNNTCKMFYSFELSSAAPQFKRTTNGLQNEPELN